MPRDTELPAMGKSGAVLPALPVSWPELLAAHTALLPVRPLRRLRRRARARVLGQGAAANGAPR